MTTRTRAYLAWVVVCVVWGTTYLAIRVAIETIPPLLMAGFRWVAAGGFLIGILAARGERLPPPAEWPGLAVLGIFLLGFGNGAVAWAEQTVPSGLTAVLVATAPFWLVSIDAFRPDTQRLGARRLAGLVSGFAGVVMLVWPALRVAGGGAFLRGVLVSQLACIGWGVGSIYTRRRPHEENVLVTAAFEMLFGGVALLFVGTAFQEWMRLSLNSRTSSALVYLTVVGSIVGFSSYTYALKHLPVAFVSLYAYVNPAIAVVLGTVILGEPLNARIGLAAGAVLLGMALVRGGSAAGPSSVAE
jgi:drug/metabolite transporter (DMT)-like permease